MLDAAQWGINYEVPPAERRTTYTIYTIKYTKQVTILKQLLRSSP